MADILLIEPDYANKYPPIGLMKISYFHKHFHHDYVRFTKGPLPEAYKDKKWDRVYVTTLFTFEWERTKRALDYALTVAKDPSQVYTGGILATLMPELISSNYPTVKNNIGLLDKKGTLGLEGEECIDKLTLDYSMLDDIEYVYPAHNAYFTYMTRGCGMKCGFCAVQTLEPVYYPYISIRDCIQRVNDEFGPKKDLLLMDNNVLRSPKFDQIIDEIIDLGFGKGAFYENPKTGKSVPRYVDFNQGLDAFLLDEHKAQRLGELAIHPARIAFDHIEDIETYKRAIHLCAENGIDHLSNYLLYNGEEFTGKGHKYAADTPKNLYERMHLSMELQEELTKEQGHKVEIFSFPMRYIPLSDLKRGYVGKNWNKKNLRALQYMLIPTQGKGVSSRPFFEADFGRTSDEFERFLAMPEEYLGYRAKFVENKKDTEVNQIRKRKTWETNQQFLTEWNRLFDLLDDRSGFLDVISDNHFTPEKLCSIRDDNHKKLYLHYLSDTCLLRVFSECDPVTVELVKTYLADEFPIMYGRMIGHVTESRIQQKIFLGLLKAYREKIICDLLEKMDFEQESHLYDAFISSQKTLMVKYFDFELLKVFSLYLQVGVFGDFEKESIRNYIINLNEGATREQLLKHFPAFKEKVMQKMTEGQMGVEFIVQRVGEQLSNVYQQLTLFEMNSNV